jgi:hypothetical protein
MQRRISLQTFADADFPDPSSCPSCARHVGAWRACPYCAAECRPSPRLLLLQVLAVLVSLTGLAMLIRSASVHAAAPGDAPGAAPTAVAAAGAP